MSKRPLSVAQGVDQREDTVDRSPITKKAERTVRGLVFALGLAVTALMGCKSKEKFEFMSDFKFGSREDVVRKINNLCIEGMDNSGGKDYIPLTDVLKLDPVPEIQPDTVVSCPPVFLDRNKQ